MTRIRILIVVATVALACAGTAWAFEALPPGGQVNDDPAAGIDPALSVSGEDPTNADVVGGALTAGKPAVPWAIFRQQQTTGAPPADQVFARSFAGGKWTTRGSGTVGGRSSAAPTFSGSLNFDQARGWRGPRDRLRRGRQDGAVGDLVRGHDRRRFRRTNNVFASRFDNTGDANQGKWIFAGQGRGLGGGTAAGAVAEHPHRPGRREPLRGRRLGGRPDEARPLGHLAGDDDRADPRSRPDLRGEADRARDGELRRRQAPGRLRRRTRPGDRWLLLAAGRLPACWVQVVPIRA